MSEKSLDVLTQLLKVFEANILRGTEKFNPSSVSYLVADFHDTVLLCTKLFSEIGEYQHKLSKEINEVKRLRDVLARRDVRMLVLIKASKLAQDIMGVDLELKQGKDEEVAFAIDQLQEAIALAEKEQSEYHSIEPVNKALLAAAKLGFNRLCEIEDSCPSPSSLYDQMESAIAQAESQS